MSLTERTIMGTHPPVRSDGPPATDFGLAVSRELERRHPVHTAKMIARTLSALGPECTIRTAENILAGKLSARTITRLTQAYGLGLLIDAGAAVTGQTHREYIEEEAAKARRDAAKLRELEFELSELADHVAAIQTARTSAPGGLPQ